MRYKLDSVGYVFAVSFGCYLDNCAEYTGVVPSGYKSLDDWATNACIQAYYIDQKGNLTLDSYRKNELEKIQAQEAINNAPVLRKDIFEVDEVLHDQYVRKTATGKVITLDDIKAISPILKITGIQPGYNNLTIYTQGKNMMRCDAVSTNTCGVTFTKNMNGSLSVLGTATENMEYVIADGKGETLFALKADTNYFLNLGGLQCELRYFDGETTAQQYVGASGLLKVPENIEVTQVVIKLHSGEMVNTTFYPQLEVGSAFTSYKEYKCKTLEISLEDIEVDLVIPRDDLYAKDTLYPGTFPSTIDYIIIENGEIYVYVGDKIQRLGNGSVGLFSDYSTIYANEDVTLEIEYSDNLIDIYSLEFLQGKSTTTNRFRILKDGSIEAHNGYFSGEIQATSGKFKGEIEANAGYFSGTVRSGLISTSTIVGGNINGATISIGNNFYVDAQGNCNANSFWSSDAHITGGSINIQTSSSDTSAIILNGIGDKLSMCPAGITLYSSGYILDMLGNSIRLQGGGDVTNILPGSITVNSLYSSPVTSGISVLSPLLMYANATIKNNYTLNVDGKLECKGNATFSGTNTFKVESTNVRLGYSYSVLGFFGNSGAVKKSVSEIYSPSSASASTVATKLNELIKALHAYNLI